MGSAKDRLMVPLPAPIKGEISNTEFGRKRKPTDEPVATADHKIYNREYLRCPYSDYRLDKPDRSSRNNLQANSPYENVRTGFGISNFEITEDKPTVFSLPFGQPKPVAPPLNPTQSTFSLSGLGLPEYGQKTVIL
uniref:Uncharacterized protein n=1 Tax=Nelumbo nucifera TaxID=4432 RepID=A0A822YMR0_NELNU|nr:TPA_asm: hypothetical protein HUJ06_012751 [Nelumbo nucifera]